jgi:hypothetical protein
VQQNYLVELILSEVEGSIGYIPRSSAAR